MRTVSSRQILWRIHTMTKRKISSSTASAQAGIKRKSIRTKGQGEPKKAKSSEAPSASQTITVGSAGIPVRKKKLLPKAGAVLPDVASNDAPSGTASEPSAGTAAVMSPVSLDIPSQISPAKGNQACAEYEREAPKVDKGMKPLIEPEAKTKKRSSEPVNDKLMAPPAHKATAATSSKASAALKSSEEGKVDKGKKPMTELEAKKKKSSSEKLEEKLMGAAIRTGHGTTVFSQKRLDQRSNGNQATPNIGSRSRGGLPGSPSVVVVCQLCDSPGHSAKQCTKLHLYASNWTPTHIEDTANAIRYQELATPEREHDSEAPVSEHYEVFLSFRGWDTRNSLTNVLHNYLQSAGISVFKDDHDLEDGDRIDKILLALANSEICIPIFSKTFAASPWCLREVEAMVKLGKEIMPVFYTATPDDVKLETVLFKDDLKKHEESRGREQVKKWEDALKAAVGYKGEHAEDRDYTEICKKLVEQVLVKLKPRKKFEIDIFGGRDVLVERMMKLLDVHSGDGVHYIGIHGMGGIGKSTFAKFISNEISSNFDGCSFLQDIREKSKRHRFKDLQKQLLKDLAPQSARQHRTLSELIRTSFSRRKVLIVLDDVDKWEQIEKLAGKSTWFGQGSRIIVVTGDIKVLEIAQQRLSKATVWPLEVGPLESTHTLRLFSLYAFGNESPEIGFESLSEEVVSTACGHPLALSFFGSLLCNERDKAVWTDVICRSKKIQLEGVKSSLRISYDKLEDDQKDDQKYDQKEIFLDIACFFFDTDKTYPIYMWEACGYFPNLGLRVLSSKSLVKISDNGKLWMYGQLRDLGRDIVREEKRDDPHQHSRVWMHEEALRVLMSKETKGKIEGLRLEGNYNTIELTEEENGCFINLRFLELRQVILKGGPEDSFPNLRWLSCHYLEHPVTNFDPTKLVVLELSNCSMSKDWCGWSKLQMARNLKALDLTGCYNLTSTPDFSNNTNLERLILRDCRNLAQIDSSIGKLKRLEHLDLEGCHSLRGLPDEIGSLEDLEGILVGGGGGEFSLPESVSNLRSLTPIELSRVGISIIPDTSGGLVNLTHLSMSRCTGLRELPKVIADLASLVELDLSYTGVSVLPNSIGRLAKLQSLYLRSTKIEELPDSFGNLKSLEKLDLMGCKIRKLPSSIGKLERLQELNADQCEFLTEIPNEIGNFSGMKYLGLSLPAKLLTILPIVREVSERLSLTIYEGPSSEEVWDSSLCQEIEKLPNLWKLHIKFSGWKYISQLPTKVDSLEFRNFTAETRLPDLSTLMNLREIKFHDVCCALSESQLGCLQKLPNLESFVLKSCTKEMVESCFQLDNLSELYIINLKSSGEVFDLSRAIYLQSLRLEECKKLVEVCGLGNLENLEELIIRECPSLKTVSNLSGLESLLTIEIVRCSKLTEIEGLGSLSLECSISIEDCTSLTNIDELKMRCRQGEFDGVLVDNCGD